MTTEALQALDASAPLAPGTRVLDVGSGTGVLVVALVYALNATLSGPQETGS